MILATTPAPTVRPRYSGHPALRPARRPSVVLFCSRQNSHGIRFGGKPFAHKKSTQLSAF
jgi:hypothetical protein